MKNKTIITIGIIAILLLVAGCSKSAPNVITGDQQTIENPQVALPPQELPDTDSQFVDDEVGVDIGESV